MVMRGGAENDGYNALVLAAGLMWRDVALIRAISRFLRQIRVPYSQDYMWATLVKHAPIAAEIVRLFHARFDPRGIDRPTSAGRSEAEIARRDRGRAAGASRASTRTASCAASSTPCRRRSAPTSIRSMRDGQPEAAHRHQVRKPQARRPAAAAPALRDLRLFAAGRGRASALRQGRARRHPLVGPAAGFPHRGARPGQGAAGEERGHRAGRRQGRLRAEAAAARRDRATRCRPRATAAYKLFISHAARHHRQSRRRRASLPPANVVRHDDDDPYLVVAADKGTATFSDIANAISQEHGFWLDDAFASGGSAGYDHKKMGITARGAWEAVKRHFREMDVDIGRRRRSPWSASATCRATCSATACCCAKTIKLVAAFDHRDIFIDPDPDPERSFAERQRLFDLPRSSWQDYDKALISQGRRRVLALAEGDRAVAGGARGARHRRAEGDAAGDDEGDPQGAGRPAVVRRHRHLCARVVRRPTSGRRPRQRCRSASPAPRSAPR